MNNGTSDSLNFVKSTIIEDFLLNFRPSGQHVRLDIALVDAFCYPEVASFAPVGPPTVCHFLEKRETSNTREYRNNNI